LKWHTLEQKREPIIILSKGRWPKGYADEAISSTSEKKEQYLIYGEENAANPFQSAGFYGFGIRPRS
jgi:hypothetical protein